MASGRLTSWVCKVMDSNRDVVTENRGYQMKEMLKWGVAKAAELKSNGVNTFHWRLYVNNDQFGTDALRKYVFDVNGKRIARLA